MPFLILSYIIPFAIFFIFFLLLFLISVITVRLLYTAAILESKKGLGLSIIHALFGPIGSFMIVLGFASGILQAKSSRALMWRGRVYSVTNQIQNAINV